MRHRVVLVAGSYMPREGGAERQMRHVLERLVLSGMDCYVITQALPGEPSEVIIGGVKVRRVGQITGFGRSSLVVKSFFLLHAVVHLLILRPQTAVSLQLGAASAAVALVGRLRRITRIIRLTGGGSPQFRSEAWMRRRSLRGRLLIRWIGGGSPALVVAPGQHLLNDFTQAFPTSPMQTRLVRNGVEAPAAELLLADEQRDGVVWYARRGSQQSTDLFLKVCEAATDIDFTVIGVGLDAPVGDNVNIVGWVSNPYAVLGRSRVLLNTTRLEGMPNLALQALACRTRVVGIANNGMKELARGFTGVALLPDAEPDPLQVVSVLKRAIRQPLLTKQQMFTLDSATEQWKRLVLERCK